MPANRPGRVVYVTNGGSAIDHGAPVLTAEGFVGVSIKQRQEGWDTTVADQSQIDANEDYAVIVKGKVLVDDDGFSKGDALYIDGSNALSTDDTDTPFGIVTEEENERGTPDGKVWVDLDLKDAVGS